MPLSCSLSCKACWLWMQSSWQNDNIIQDKTSLAMKLYSRSNNNASNVNVHDWRKRRTLETTRIPLCHVHERRSKTERQDWDHRWTHKKSLTSSSFLVKRVLSFLPKLKREQHHGRQKREDYSRHLMMLSIFSSSLILSSCYSFSLLFLFFSLIDRRRGKLMLTKSTKSLGLEDPLSCSF